MEKFWEIFWAMFSIAHCIMIFGGLLTLRLRLIGLRKAELMLMRQRSSLLDVIGVAFATWYLWPFFMMGFEWPVRVIAPNLVAALKQLLAKEGHIDHIDLDNLRQL